MEQYSILKTEIINFIKTNLYDSNANENSNLTELMGYLNRIIQNRQDEHHHDDWPDDQILQEAYEYVDKLIIPEKKQRKNITNAKNVSLVARKGDTYLPKELELKIQTYVVKPTTPLGGKRKSRKNNKKNKKNKKNKNNKRKSRRHRK